MPPQRGHLRFHLVRPVVPLSVLISVPCLHRLARRVRHDGRRPARCLCGGVPSSANSGLVRRRRVHSRKSGIVRKAGKSIIQMLLRGHQVTLGGFNSVDPQNNHLRQFWCPFHSFWSHTSRFIMLKFMFYFQFYKYVPRCRLSIWLALEQILLYLNCTAHSVIYLTQIISLV